MKDPHYAYRADIDGLRAIAVTSVVAFHAFPDFVPGGFVGVDVFFVISGFLITSILLREIADSTFSIRAFYVRRIKRIFPALALVLVAALIFGWAVLLEDEFRALGKHTAAGAGFISNIVLWDESGYFDTDTELKPLMHLWSLGIEEQFYILWPLALAFIFKARLDFLLVATIAALLSFAANIASVEIAPQSTFLLPHFRFWELLLGALLAGAILPLDRRRDARLPDRPKSKSSIPGETIALVGLTLIGSSVIVIDADKSFPGWWALLPTLGTSLLIGAGSQTWISRRLLSHPALVLVGLISYPLYLWHWPLFSYARIIYAGQPPLQARFVLATTAFALAWATYKYVELPVRARASTIKQTPTVPTGLVVTMIAVLFIGIRVQQGVPEARLHALSAILSEARQDWHYPGDTAALIEGEVGGNLLFLGDSYIQQLYPRIEYLAGRYGTNHPAVIFHTAPGCAPVPGIARKSEPDCITYTQRGFELAASTDVEVVIIGGSWLGMQNRNDYFRENDPEEQILDLRDAEVLSTVLAGLEKQLARLRSLGKEVYIVLNPPGGGKAEPGKLEGARRLGSGERLEPKSIPISEHLARTAAVNEPLEAIARRVGAEIIDPATWICSNGKCALTDPNGIPYFKDSTHLRASFVRCCLKDLDILIPPPAESRKGK